jgi:hypothetical protein
LGKSFAQETLDDKLFVAQFTFPEPNNRPAARAEIFAYFGVAAAIALYFLPPVGFVVFRFCIAAVMTVPKTTVHEHRYFLREKHKIRFAESGIISSPTGEPTRFEKGDKPQFGRSVAFAFDLPHNRASLLG